MTTEDRDWPKTQRMSWWIKTVGIAAAMATTSLAVHKWILTRASVEYVDQRIETLEPRANARSVESRLEKKIDAHSEVLGNVRDNLIILMDRQRIEPKPMPDRVLP